MANLHGFNAGSVEPMTEYEPIPAAKYLAVIVKSEMKPTKNGKGRLLELEFEVIEGEFKGRKVWTRLNLENPNALTVKIARSELSSICRAIGVMAPTDSVELHNVPVVISVAQKTGSDGVLRNVIKGYAKRDLGADRPVQAASATPPWRR